MRRWCIPLVLVGIANPAGAEGVPATCKAAAPNSKLSITLQPDTPITELITWVVGFTCKNVVIDTAAKAHSPKVTVVAAKPMTPSQALQLFVDAVEATGLDVTVKKETIQIKLGANMRTCPAVADATPPVTFAPGPAAPAVDIELDKLVDANVKRVDDTHVEVTQKLVDELVNNPARFARGARVVPAVKDGKPDGFKLYAIRPSSLFAKLGFQNGDTLRRINGIDMTSPDKALELYTTMRNGKKADVDIMRRGSPLTITFVVK